MPTFYETLFNLLDHLSEYHYDLIPQRSNTIDDLLEKYFYWVTEYNDGYSEALMNPRSNFEKWLCEKSKSYM